MAKDDELTRGAAEVVRRGLSLAKRPNWTSAAVHPLVFAHWQADERAQHISPLRSGSEQLRMHGLAVTTFKPAPDDSDWYAIHVNTKDAGPFWHHVDIGVVGEQMRKDEVEAARRQARQAEAKHGAERDAELRRERQREAEARLREAERKAEIKRRQAIAAERTDKLDAADFALRMRAKRQGK